ncbi:MAG TPA: hypothetical protein VHL11_21040, partial [Phototrophicaceae bacterium]|nr:hypothetical protein [Phototrophicaceae bacterium]
LELGSTAQTIGRKANLATIPLLQVFLGDNYRDDRIYGGIPLTTTLIDLVQPPAGSQDNVLALLYVYDENKKIGHFRFSQSGSVQQMVLSPDNQTLLIRRYLDDEYVLSYSIASGEEQNRFLPALRGIGGYRNTAKNRILAYDQSGEVVISDFQRIDATTHRVFAEDLRYSRSFDRFFFSDDSQKLITLAGTEWREWSIATGEVLRRDIVSLNGEIVATAPDGSRFLAYNYGTNDGGAEAEVLDLNVNQHYHVYIAPIPGTYVEEIYPNASWTKFLAVYGANSYDQYYPGNQIAIYDYQTGFQELIAGDDLPPSDQRQYGWVDDDTAFVYGQGTNSGIVERVYGVNYAANSLPECLMEHYPQESDHFALAWERMVLNLRPDKLNEWTQYLCDHLPNTVEGVDELLRPTPTPIFVTPTGVPIGEVPLCLTAHYSKDAQAYADVWTTITADLTPEDAAELADMICEGLNASYNSGEFDPSLGLTMFIDADTGERSSGDYRAPAVEQRPLDPIYRLFKATEGRDLYQVILSPDQQFIAVSNLPGELVVYRLIVTYDSMMVQLTATSDALLATANLIKAQASPSPTDNI